MREDNTFLPWMANIQAKGVFQIYRVDSPYGNQLYTRIVIKLDKKYKPLIENACITITDLDTVLLKDTLILTIEHDGYNTFDSIYKKIVTVNTLLESKYKAIQAMKEICSTKTTKKRWWLFK